MSSADSKSRVIALAEQALQESDLFLVDVVVRGRKGSQVVEVYVDGDSGVGVDDLASLSRELGFMLETEDVIKGKYNLNVSSPGEDRSLKLARQYQRHLGKPINVKVADDVSSEQSEVTGVNRGVSDDVLCIEKESGEELTIPLETVESARVQLPW